ncbi:MAG: hypothetical protein O9264_13905 [Leptospira sp.]|nr:hypothetical protein [Leptospira sp.]
MGSGFGVKCNTCNASWEGTLGIGMLYAPDRINEALSDPKGTTNLIRSKSIKNEIANILNHHGLLTEYEHSSYICSSCNWIYDRFFVNILTFSKEGNYTPKYKCTKCKKPLIRVDMEIKENGVKLFDGVGNRIPWHCPKCKGTHLVEDNDSRMNGLCWD